MKKITCSMCKKEKAVRAFAKRPERAKGYKSACKLCEKGRYAAQRQQYRQRNREKFKGRTSDWRMRKIYGVDKAWLDAQYQKQEGKCPICLNEFNFESSNKLSPVIDHDHTSGKVRGLLCRNCNRAVGLMNDDPEMLARAARYLHEKGYEVRI